MKINVAKRNLWMGWMAVGIVVLAVGGVGVWRFHVQMIEQEIEAKRAALKKLLLAGHIPPNQEVVDYLTSRQVALDARYHHWLALAAAVLPPQAALGDPQLYFQEQVHELQRTLERQAVARSVAVPEPLGIPKELPPREAVPNLLVQLSLIQQVASAILEQGIPQLSSLKVEDPQSMSSVEGTDFLVRLPVRVRFNCALSELTTLLGSLQHLTPLTDLRTLRVTPTANEDMLDVELILARYLFVQSETSVDTEKVDAEKENEPTRSQARSSPHANKRQSKPVADQ